MITIDWRLHGSLSVAAVIRMRWYQSISSMSLLPLVDDVFGYIATNQWTFGWSVGDSWGKFVMKTLRSWVGHCCCNVVLRLVSVVSVSNSVMWTEVNRVRLSASASGQPIVSIARICRCCSQSYARGDRPTRWMGVLENGRLVSGSGWFAQAVDTCTVAAGRLNAMVAAWARWSVLCSSRRLSHPMLYLVRKSHTIIHLAFRW
jgi:hypothetical protein